MKRILLGLAAAFAATAACAQVCPRARRSPSTMVTQLSPTIPEYTRVDIPMLREELPKRSGGRIQVTLASWPERNLTVPELLRAPRAGQIDVGGIALPTVAGDVPLLDIIDLAGLLSSHAMGRKVAEAVMPGSTRSSSASACRSSRPIRSPEVCFGRDPISSLADIKGRRVRTTGGPQNDLVQSTAAQPVAIGFPNVILVLQRGVDDWPDLHRHRQWRALVRGDQASQDASGPVRRRRLRREPRVVEQARSGGARLPAKRDEPGAGEEWALGLELTQDGVACNARDKGRLQDRPRGG